MCTSRLIHLTASRKQLEGNSRPTLSLRLLFNFHYSCNQENDQWNESNCTVPFTIAKSLRASRSDKTNKSSCTTKVAPMIQRDSLFSPYWACSLGRTLQSVVQQHVFQIARCRCFYQTSTILGDKSLYGDAHEVNRKCMCKTAAIAYVPTKNPIKGFELLRNSNIETDVKEFCEYFERTYMDYLNYCTWELYITIWSSSVECSLTSTHRKKTRMKCRTFFKNAVTVKHSNISKLISDIFPLAPTSGTKSSLKPTSTFYENCVIMLVYNYFHMEHVSFSKILVFKFSWKIFRKTK